MLVVIDFMAFIRKLSLRKMKIKTYGELAGTLRDRLIQTAGTCFRIDIIFDVYRRFSIKDRERIARGLNQGITVAIKEDSQCLPVDMQLFWNSIVNETELQKYFINWMIRNTTATKINILAEFMISDASRCLLAKNGDPTSLKLS